MLMTVLIIIILILFLIALSAWFIIENSKNKELTLHVFDLIINFLSLFTIILVIHGLSIDNSNLDLTLAKARGRAKEYKISAYLYSNIYAMPKVRTIHSPDNFDDIEKEDSLRYSWIEDNRDQIISNVKNLQKIEIEGYPQSSALSGLYIDTDSLFFEAIDDYNRELEEINKKEKDLSITEGDHRMMQLLSAFLAAIAFGLFFVKWLWIYKKQIKKKNGIKQANHKNLFYTE